MRKFVFFTTSHHCKFNHRYVRVGRDTQGFLPSKVEQPMMEDKRSFISRLASSPKKTNPRAIDFEPSLKTSDRKVMVKEQKPPSWNLRRRGSNRRSASTLDQGRYGKCTPAHINTPKPMCILIWAHIREG